MFSSRLPRQLWMILTLGLFALGLVMLPCLGALPQLEAEHVGGFEPVETDDELEAEAAFGASSAGVLFFEAQTARLHFQSLPLTIILPPPNQN